MDVRTFKISHPDAADEEIISNVLATDEYRDDYAGGGIDPGGIRHGPYWISSISPSSFDAIDASVAADIFDRWRQNCGATPPALANDLEDAVVNVIARSDSVYTLKRLDPTAINDYGDLHI
ncbi:hypothetical protein ACFWU5_01885 [Nocardia sp. NPDC058640]|uniref:hypothetical protein n=1 Tax=Nocardia sp. NPDC058640 TaxID=3346571 RepID=UPI00364E8BC7